jgi:hypothetical protein
LRRLRRRGILREGKRWDTREVLIAKSRGGVRNTGPREIEAAWGPLRWLDEEAGEDTEYAGRCASEATSWTKAA